MWSFMRTSILVRVRSCASLQGHALARARVTSRFAFGDKLALVDGRGASWARASSAAVTGRVVAVALAAAAAAATSASALRDRTPSRCDVSGDRRVLVVGSVNADIVIEIDRLPQTGETISARSVDTGTMVPGGKGANQAVAAARLMAGTGNVAQFVCQLGHDSHAETLEGVLQENGVDTSACGHVSKPSGQAFVFLQADGSNSILIVGGSNMAWPSSLDSLKDVVRKSHVLMIQREIPEEVNEAVAEAAFRAGVPVIQDVGGEDRPLSPQLLRRTAYLCPNETELERLTGLPTRTPEEVIIACKKMQASGAHNILVTLGSEGSVLVTEKGQVLRQPSFGVPGGRVVDTTGAGDAFRAAFAVALVEGRPLQDCMAFGAAAGSVAVSRMGAMPSLPSREEVLRLSGLGAS